MANKEEVVGSNPGAGYQMVNVDCFTQHNPPATLETHVKHNKWVWEVKKINTIYV